MWKKAVFGTVTAGFLSYVVWFSCFSSAPHQVEWEVANRVIDVLQRSGFDQVVPIVDGRDVELRGHVADAKDADRAERIVGMIRGVRIVRANMLVSRSDGGGGGDS
jgi:hypothetical protein